MKRKSPKFRKALAAKGVDSFDSYVQKFSPKLRKMKQNQIEELLENDQYNSVPGSDDDAKHWLTPLTGKIKLNRHHLAVSFKLYLSWILFLLSGQISESIFSKSVSCAFRR